MVRSLHTVMALLSAIGGCAHHRAEAPTGPAATYLPGRDAETGPAPADAVYTLYRETDGRAVATRFLLAGSTLGFSRDGYGQPLAVASGERMPLSNGPHHWQVNPADFQQTEKRLREEVAAAVFQRIDRMTDAVGRVMYPPLYVAAFPLWALCGGGAIGRGFGK